MQQSSRRAFTLVELLVVIAIIGTLVGLLLPAIQAARERARQATCLNNVGQLGKAMFSYATNGKQAFPGWASYEKLPRVGTQARALPIPWSAKILSELDQRSLRDQMLTGDTSLFTYNAPPRLDVFICASDVQTNDDVAALSYVVNAGMPDPIANTLPNGFESPDLKFNGVCHDLRPGRGKQVKVGISDIRDGTDTTILLAENVHKDQPTTWIGPVNSAAGPVDADFVADMSQNPEQRYGMVWLADSNSPEPPNPNDFQPISRDTRNPSPGEYTVGFGHLFARPASLHGDVFVAGFCGGSAKGISNDIEYRVYQQLMTPVGQKVAFADDQNASPTLEQQYLFMSPPIAAGDY